MADKTINYYKYYTDTNELIHINITYETNIRGIDYRRRLLDGGFNSIDIIDCAKPTRIRNLKPRHIIYNYGSYSNPIKLKIIFKNLPNYISFINNNKDFIYRYIGEDANPNTIKII